MLKFFLKSLLVVGVLVGIGYLAYPPIAASIKERNKPRWRTVEVENGEIIKVVNATGKVRPVKKVQVGSFVSGPILDLFVEHNQEVEADELLATIDPRLIAASVARDKASLETRRADVKRVEALLQQARNDEARAAALREENVDYIAQAEMDRVKFNRLSLEAQLTIANASIDQATATLTSSEANLNYCEIRSPEDGMIIERKVEPGQTLASTFQTPELFVIGVGMREKMHIYADVDESEIGLIRTAAENEQPVNVTVNAYPDDLFDGLIEEVRFSAVETQSVVTYPVIVGAANPELKLLPGMTADLTFQIEKKEDVVKIPKAALRFYPPNKEHVHPDDQHIVDGTSFISAASDEDDEDEISEVDEQSAAERVMANKKSKKKHVWYVEEDLLRAIEVEIGLSDNRFAELVGGELAEGKALVTGQKAAGEQ
jgi:HlyD family secretion protein